MMTVTTTAGYPVRLDCTYAEFLAKPGSNYIVDVPHGTYNHLAVPHGTYNHLAFACGHNEPLNIHEIILSDEGQIIVTSPLP